MGWLTAIEDRWAPPGVVRYIAGVLGGRAYPRKKAAGCGLRQDSLGSESQLDRKQGPLSDNRLVHPRHCSDNVMELKSDPMILKMLCDQPACRKIAAV